MIAETFELDISITKKLLEGERGKIIRERDIIVRSLSFPFLYLELLPVFLYNICFEEELVSIFFHLYYFQLYYTLKFGWRGN